MRYIALLLLCSCLHPVTPRILSLPSGCRNWGPLPLRVGLASNALDMKEYVQYGMDVWNQAVGRPVFVWGDDPHVLVVEGITRKTTESGYAERTCVDGRPHTVVVMRAHEDAITQANIAAHELGHALGLGHSTNEQSVMQARLYTGLLDEPRFYRITEADARLVKLLHNSHQPATVPPKTNKATIVSSVPEGN